MHQWLIKLVHNGSLSLYYLKFSFSITNGSLAHRVSFRCLQNKFIDYSIAVFVLCYCMYFLNQTILHCRGWWDHLGAGQILKVSWLCRQNPSISHM